MKTLFSLVVLVVLVISFASPVSAQTAKLIPSAKQSIVLRLPDGMQLTDNLKACGEHFLSWENRGKLAFVAIEPDELVKDKQQLFLGGEEYSVFSTMHVFDPKVVVVMISDEHREPRVEILQSIIAGPELVLIALRQADYDRAKGCLPPPKIERRVTAQ